MVDPLAEVVTLLQPGASLSKLVTARGRWRVRRSEAERVFYCVILDGTCRLAVAGHEPIVLQKGDFVLVPSAYDFTVSSLEPPPKDVETLPIAMRDGEFRLGMRGGEPEVRMLVGHCVFGSPDAALLVSLLPRLVHVHGQERLRTLVQLVGEETRERRPGRDVILAHLLSVLLIEALRSTEGPLASAGLLRGLADERLRYDGCTKARPRRGRSRSWRRQQRCLVPRSSNASAARWASPRWSTCSAGVWRWRRTYCGGEKSPWAKSRNESAIAPRARSASHSRATSDSRRRSTYGTMTSRRGRNERQRDEWRRRDEGDPPRECAWNWRGERIADRPWSRSRMMVA